MTLTALPSPNFTGADLSARVNAALLEVRVARRFVSLAALQADTTMAYGSGSRPVAINDVVKAQGFYYQVASSAATDHHMTTAGGVKLKVLPGDDGSVNFGAFGVVGDGVTDNTAAFTAAFAAGFLSYTLNTGVYLCGNVSLPNRELHIVGHSRWDAIIRASASFVGDAAYLWASSQWLNNGAYGGDPIYMSGLQFDGAGVVTYPLMMRTYFSELTDCFFTGPAATGYALAFTTSGKGGTALIGTLVENKVRRCRMDGVNVGGAFAILDTQNKSTDFWFQDNEVLRGEAFFDSMAGGINTGNHFYAGSVRYLRQDIGSVIANNYYENGATFDNALGKIVSVDGCKFNARVTAVIGNAPAETLIFNGCVWLGASADLYHTYNASTKRVIINGGGFEATTPVVWANTGSQGLVALNNVWIASTGTFWTGTQRGSINGGFRQTMPIAPSISSSRGDANVTVTWLSANTTQRFSTTLTANRTVTLATTDAVNGAKLRFVRTAGGAFSLDIGGLKTLATGQWCEVEFDGTAWVLTAFGSL